MTRALRLTDRRLRHRQAEENAMASPWRIEALHTVAELCAARVPLLRLVPLNPLFESRTVLLQFVDGRQLIAFEPLASGVEELACCPPATAVPYHCSRPGKPFLVCFESPRGLILLTCNDLVVDLAPGASGGLVSQTGHVCPA